jgi:hypothetical protein
MNFDNPANWLLGGVAVVVLVYLWRHFFTQEARLERRRRKSNARVVSSARRPAVKFSVHTEEEKGKRKS